jgi:hypothetical protein
MHLTPGEAESFWELTLARDEKRGQEHGWPADRERRSMATTMRLSLPEPARVLKSFGPAAASDGSTVPTAGWRLAMSARNSRRILL